MRLLLVEDHARLAIKLTDGLRRQGFAVDVAFDGREALERAAVINYDVVILDRDLPLIHGDEVCRRLISGSDDVADWVAPRVLMLTAANSIDDQVEGLGIGADDYLPKPFAFAVLVARIRALARRTAAATPPIIEHGGVRLDPAKRLAERDGTPLTLRPKEFAVLERLLTAHGDVVTSEQLLFSVWDEMADPFSNTVKTTVSRLRSKLGDPPLIETVPPGGYRIAVP